MARTPELQRFYGSKRWRDLREWLIIDRQAHCDRCGKDFSDDTSQLIAHHKEHLTNEALADPEIAVNPDNIEILCYNCHSHEHPKGIIVKQRKQVFIVYGAPFSGKTSYVRDNLMPGDLIVDLDALYSAISGQPLYTRPPEVKRNVFALRDALYDQIRTRNGDWQTAWVISGLPRKDERERLAARLGASLILIESTKEECVRRLMESSDGRDAIEWQRFIDQWFRDYIP